MFDHPETISKIINQTRTIAVVGLSPKPDRTSHQVSSYLQQVGYTIIPVNPGAEAILGEKCYANLTEIPDKVDLVLVFRRSEFIPPIVDAVIHIKPQFLWLQEGIYHEEAGQKAAAAGIEVIMDRCMFKEHRLRQ